MREFADIRTVAAALHVTPPWLKRHLDQLIAAGFPEPALKAGHRRLWDPQAIELWQDSLLPPHLRPVQRATPSEIEDAEAELLRRCANITAGSRT